MSIPDYALLPHVIQALTPGNVGLAGTVVSIGNLAGLKAHVAVEHDEDDVYLTELLDVAQHMVAEYTRWPIWIDTRLVDHIMEGRWEWPLPRSPGRVDSRSYAGHRIRPHLCLPGPVDVGSNIYLRGYSDGVMQDPGELLSVAFLDRLLPHDAAVVLSDDIVSGYDDGGFGELIIRYQLSWSSYYPLPEPWPQLLAVTIYRLAATMYLYREATVMGDQPLHRIMQAALGPFLPVVL